MPAVFDNFCVIMIPVLWLLKLILDWWLLMRDSRLWEVLSNWGATQVQPYIKENPFLDIVKHVSIKWGAHNPELATLTLGLCQAVFTDRFSFMKMMWTAEIQIFKCWYDPCSDECNLSNCANEPENNSTGFEPMASALALQCSSIWAIWRPIHW